LLFGLAIWAANLTVALILGAVGLGLGLMHGICMAIGHAYDFGNGVCWFKFILDNTWSVLNSLAGSLYQLVNLIIFNPITRTGAGTGTVVHRRGIIPGYATTIGQVIASEDPGVQDPRAAARAPGPHLRTPVYSAGHGQLRDRDDHPYWLIFHNHQRWPITGFGTYFINGVYPHAWNEEWAYRACP
jgi:hypothetical protein